jgi:very-short-patch-repair endonuclease
MPHRSVPTYQRQNARNLRRAMTDVERKLWEALRANRLAGVDFRRQMPIGPYIVDFVCHAARLVIELDGGQHNQAEHIERDEVRDRFIAAEGYRVLRFWNFEINSEFEACVDRIYLTLIEQGRPLETSGISSTPLPLRERGVLDTRPLKTRPPS